MKWNSMYIIMLGDKVYRKLRKVEWINKLQHFVIYSFFFLFSFFFSLPPQEVFLCVVVVAVVDSHKCLRIKCDPGYIPDKKIKSKKIVIYTSQCKRSQNIKHLNT